MPQLQNISKAIRPILESRHQPSGLNSRFNGEQLSFSDYVASSRKMLFEARSHGKPHELEKMVAGNAPFELWPAENYPAGLAKPYRRGVLLVHGLTDSPYFMRHLASFFQQCGFRVMAILLPGHGTQPGDLLDVRWQEWVRAVAYGVEQLDKEVNEIYLAGLSAGAALSIRHSLFDSRVRGLLLFSPALRITSLAAWAKLHKIISWLQPSAQWVDIMPDLDIYKYESFPKNAAAQMHALTQDLHRQLRGREIGIPVFAAASADDTTVDSEATVEFMRRAHHPCSRLVYYTMGSSQCPSGIPESNIELVNSVVPDQKIISFSHLSIVLSPDDAHYGMTGDYSNCLHYYPDDMDKYAACISNSPPILQGEVSMQNLRAGLIRRLMYNPHFAALEISMQRFIEGLP